MRRRLIIIALALAALVVPTIVVVVIVKSNPKLQNAVLRVANVNQPTVANLANTNRVTAAADANRARVLFVARNFAEQYGSGSNQNDFANLVQAEQFGTAAFNSSLNASITQQRSTLKTTPYHSYVTRVIVLSIGSLSPTSATVTITTRRVETTDQTPKTYFQDLILVMQKVGTDWKVASAGWKV